MAGFSEAGFSEAVAGRSNSAGKGRGSGVGSGSGAGSEIGVGVGSGSGAGSEIGAGVGWGGGGRGGGGGGGGWGWGCGWGAGGGGRGGFGVEAGEGVFFAGVAVGGYVFEGCLLFVAGVEPQALSHFEAVAAGGVVGEVAQRAEGVASGALHLLGECVDVVAPHLACDLVAHALAGGEELDDVGAVGVGAADEGDGAGGGVVGAGGGVVVGALQHTVEGADAGDLDPFSLFYKLYDKVCYAHGILFAFFGSVVR